MITGQEFFSRAMAYVNEADKIVDAAIALGTFQQYQRTPDINPGYLYTPKSINDAVAALRSALAEQAAWFVCHELERKAKTCAVCGRYDAPSFPDRGGACGHGEVPR